MKKELLIAGLLITVAGAQNVASPVVAKENERSQKPEKVQIEKRRTTQTLAPDSTATPSASTSPSATPKVKAKDTTAPTTTQVRRDKNGAQFTLDQATGLVTVTTPSGNTHTLKLPPKAVENMFKNKLIETPVATDSAKPATDSGKLAANEEIVTQEVTEKKLLLGTIPVKVKMNFTINTSTGETKFEAKSFLARMFGFLLNNE